MRRSIGRDRARVSAASPTTSGVANAHRRASAPQEGGDVFHEHESGSKVANGVGDRSPEAGGGAVDAFAFAGVGDVLAGEAGGDDVDRRDRGPVDGADVA